MRKYWLLATFLSLAAPILHAGIVPTQALAQTAISQDEKLSTLFSKTLSSVEMKRSTSIQSLLYIEPFAVFIDPHAAYDGFLNIYEKATDPALRRYAAWRMTLAAEQLGRCCRMVEFEPIYVDVIIKRWEELTSMKAVRIGNILEDKKPEPGTKEQAVKPAAKSTKTKHKEG